MAKNGDQKMRNGPTASATDTAMRNSWNEKKKHQCKLINLGRTSACFKQILGISWLSYSWCALKIFSVRKCFAYLILGSTHKPHRGTRGVGRGWVDGTPPLSFWYVAVFRKDFTFSGKPLIFSKKWGDFHGSWRCWRPVTSPNMVAILDFTKN